MIENQIRDKRWAAGDDFTMADCAALPALFFASIVHPFSRDQRYLATYLDRLMQRPSVRRVIDEARPYFAMFPYRDAMPKHYLET
jgi:glutathione S-transferase